VHDDIWMLVRRKEQKMDRQIEEENGQTDGIREWTDRWKKRTDRQEKEENGQTD